MYVGELHAGNVIWHARWKLGRVVRMEEAYAIIKFSGRRRKIAMNDQVAVWVRAEQATLALGVAA